MGPHLQATQGGTSSKSPPGGADARDARHSPRCLARHCGTVIGQPTLAANQLHLARLPVTAGGLGLPHLPTLALIARTSCLATLPRAAHTDSFRQTLVRQEGDLLLACLRGLSGPQPSPPQSQTHQIHSFKNGERLVETKSGARHQWLRNLPGDSPALPDSYHGHGEWLHCLPGKWETTLLDPVFRLGLSQRLGYTVPWARANAVDAPHRGQTMPTHSRPIWQHVAPKRRIPEDMTGSGI